MAAWRWETFREIADPYHCQSIGTSHTWRSILLPHPNSVPPRQHPPTTDPSHPPHLLLQKAGLKLPHRPRGPPAKAQLCGIWSLSRLRAGKVRAVTAAVGHWQQVWARALPRTHLRGIPAWGRAHMPQQSPRFASSCKYICWICPTRDLLETFPPLRTAPVCPVKGAP